MSRSFAPLRSVAGVVSRRTVASRVIAPQRTFISRLYSTESPAEGASGANGTSTASVEELNKKVAELEAAKTEAENKVKELQKDVLYGKAEIQTLSRRVIDERTKASEFAISAFARNLIGTSDILTAALKHVPKPLDPGSPLETLYNGVNMTQKAMFKTFGEHGVVPMELAPGSQFDPNLHEATFQIPAAVAPPKSGGGEWAPGEIVEIGKEGWMIGSRVLRPAQVGVIQIE